MRFLFLCLLAALSCATPPSGGHETGIVHAGFTTDPQTLTMVGKTDRYSEIVGRLLTDSLFQYDAGLNLQPVLASSWDLSPDGLTATFRLQRGVRWHDGAPLTARDVLFTVSKVRDPSTEAASYLSQFQDLVSIEAPDEYTVRASYSKFYADFLEGWTVPIIPEHLAGKDEHLLTGEFARHPIGCGPFRFVRYEPGIEIVLEANPDYWAGPLSVRQLVFRIIPDDRTGYQALLRGDLSMALLTPDLWMQAQRSEEARRLKQLFFYRNTVWHIGWNQDGSNPFFTEPGTRRAMVLTLDRPRFIETVLHGLAKPAATSYHPDTAWADPGTVPWPYDPEEAARLLDEAGWTDSDGDGVRDRDGRPFAFTLNHASTQEIGDRTAAWVQQSLAAVGVKMQIEKLEWRTFLERRRAHKFQAAMSQLSFTIPDQFELYHSSARENGLNYFGLSDQEVDRLVESGRTTFDTDERREIYRRLQGRLHELEPISCLFHFASPLLHDPHLEGLEPSFLDLWRTTPGPRAWLFSPGE